jgi:hypothetical protein
MQRKFQCFEHGFTFKKTTTRFYGILTVLTFSFFVLSWKPLPTTNKRQVSAESYSANAFAVQQLIMSYDVSKFKAGQSGVSKPSVSIKGGTFSYTRVDADSNGGLNINLVSGWISHTSSNPGTYLVSYSYNNLKATVTIVVE